MPIKHNPSHTDPPTSSQPGRQTRMYPGVSGVAPHPVPGAQEHLARRFELARSLIQQHTRLGSRRALVALLLALADLFLLGLELWLVFTYSAGSGNFPAWERTFTIIFLVSVLLLLLVSLGFALAAAFWKHNPAGQTQPTSAVFFQSEGAAIPDPAQFSQLFRRTTQEQLQQGALHELASLARWRRRQELWLRVSIIFLAIALLGLCKQAVLAALLF